MNTRKSMRFSTLLSKHGPVKHATDCTHEEWQSAIKETRFLTVYHGENDWSTPLVGMVGHHGCVNTICKLVLTKPVPPSVHTIIGMRDNDEAWALCHPQ
jgi:hypothetical protein